MGKVNAMFQDAEEAKFDRQTEIMVEADVEIMFANGNVSHMTISNIPCTWVWDESSRDAAEYWAVMDRVDQEFTYDWFTIKSWVGSPVKKEIDQC